jgi:hypothetical protein
LPRQRQPRLNLEQFRLAQQRFHFRQVVELRQHRQTFEQMQPPVICDVVAIAARRTAQQRAVRIQHHHLRERPGQHVPHRSAGGAQIDYRDGRLVGVLPKSGFQ